MNNIPYIFLVHMLIRKSQHYLCMDYESTKNKKLSESQH